MAQDDTVLPFPTAESAPANPVPAAASERADTRAPDAAPDTPPEWVARPARRAHEAIDALAAKAASAAGKVEGGKASLADAKARWMDAARDAIREKPFAAVGLAALAGLLVAAARQGRR